MTPRDQQEYDVWQLERLASYLASSLIALPPSETTQAAVREAIRKLSDALEYLE